MIRLVELEAPCLTAGMVLRFVTKGFDVEAPVDFMIFYPSKQDRGLGLIEITGYHAGDIYVIFPKESNCPQALTEIGAEYTLSREWLEKNWNKWVCEDCDVKDVWVIESYPDPKLDY